MEFEKLVKERRSIRKFKAEKISHETVLEIVEKARFAPSWKNTQIVRYFIVEDEEVKEKLTSEEVLCNFMYNKPVIDNAACVVLVCYRKGRSGFEKDGSYSTPYGDHWESFDCGVAAQTFCLAAADMGIGTVIQGYIDAEAARRAAGIPEDLGISCMISMGYPDEAPDVRPRKEAAELVSFI